MHGSYLRGKFDETGLPKSALAGYLGVSLPTISKVLNHGRSLSAREYVRTRAFFSIVPHRADHFFRRAVAKLRSPRVRERAGRGLAAFAVGHDVPTPILNLLTRAKRGEAPRADQIVALCVCGGLDLPTLVATGKVRHVTGAVSDTAVPLFSDFDAAAQSWAKAAGAPEPYRLDGDDLLVDVTASPALAVPTPRGGTLQAPVASEPYRVDGGDTQVDVKGLGVHAVPASQGIALHRTDAAVPAVTGVTAYVVPDGSLSPRFEEGDTLFLDDAGKASRNGDLVAAVLGGDADSTLQVVVGRLLFRTRDLVMLRLPGGQRLELASSEIRSIRRIAFVAF